MSRPQPPHVMAAGASRASTGNPVSHEGHFARICIGYPITQLLDYPIHSSAHHPGKNDGSGRSRMVCRPGGASSTFGIELTAIDAVATSPWMPPAIFIDRFGDPWISTE